MKTLLIVEDDRSLNKGIALSLAQNDLIIEQAYTVAMADQIISSTQIDLILLDVNLPDGSGLDYCEKIRKTSQVPIIFLTANDMEPDIVTGFALGADDYITKPFSLMVLRARVMAVLRRSDAPASDRVVIGPLEFDFGKMEYFKNSRRQQLFSEGPRHPFVQNILTEEWSQRQECCRTFFIEDTLS